MNPGSRQHRPIRPREIKKLSIVRNPGTGPLLERHPANRNHPLHLIADEVWCGKGKVIRKLRKQCNLTFALSAVCGRC
jgi:hypothetical protein